MNLLVHHSIFHNHANNNQIIYDKIAFWPIIIFRSIHQVQVKILKIDMQLHTNIVGNLI
jgi:hypothetical protein